MTTRQLSSTWAGSILTLPDGKGGYLTFQRVDNEPEPIEMEEWLPLECQSLADLFGPYGYREEREDDLW